MRTVLIRIDGAKHPIRKLQLREGTRVSDILRHLKVPADYSLALASEPTNPLPSEAEIHALVPDAASLIVQHTSAVVENTEAFRLTVCT